MQDNRIPFIDNLTIGNKLTPRQRRILLYECVRAGLIHTPIPVRLSFCDRIYAWLYHDTLQRICRLTLKEK